MAGRAPDTLPNARSWATRANCRYDDPETYFAERAVGSALAACRTCPVRQQCLEEAMTAEGTLTAGSRFGIFGGLTPQQRADRSLAEPAPPQPIPIGQPQPTPRWNGRELAPCGTRAAYRRHLRRGEVPCRACVAAEARARQDRHARRKSAAA